MYVPLPRGWQQSAGSQYHGVVLIICSFSIRCEPVASSLHRRHEARIFVMRKQWILAILCLCIFEIRPSSHELLMAVNLCQLARHCAVHVGHDVEICREENVKEALLDLSLLCQFFAQVE